MSEHYRSDHPGIAKFALLFSAAAATVPIGLYGMTAPMMTWTETVILMVLFVGGMIGGYAFAYRRPLFGAVVFPAVLFGVSFAFTAYFYAQREARLAPLRARLAEYTHLKVEPPAKDATAPALRKKILAIDLDKQAIDLVHLLLPDDLRADQPEEIGIVVYLHHGETPVGEYPDGGIAFRRTCDVQVVEYGPKPRLFWEKRLEGGEPPDRGSSGDLYGKPPYPQIIEYLGTLPRAGAEPR